MDLLYQSKCVDILFDKERNVLVQKWKDRKSYSDLIYGPKSNMGLRYNLAEIVTTQLYDDPSEDFEAELQIMLFQYFPGKMPKA